MRCWNQGSDRLRTSKRADISWRELSCEEKINVGHFFDVAKRDIRAESLLEVQSMMEGLIILDSAGRASNEATVVDRTVSASSRSDVALVAAARRAALS